MNKRLPSETATAVLSGLRLKSLEGWNTQYRVIRNDCRGFNNLSHTIHLR